MVPGGLKPFAPGAAVQRFFLFEQVEGDAVEDREILGGVAGAFTVQVFAEADIEHPVQFVFDALVLADHRVQPRRVRPEAGDVVADFTLDFARRLMIALALDTHQPL